MSLTFTRLGKLVLPAAALTLSAFGLAGGSNATSAGAADLPLTCDIAVSKGRYGHTYEGRVQAAQSIHGSYELSISKRGSGGSAMISQSGEFNVPAGRTETLGQATFGGLPPSSVDAELILYWNGMILKCRNNSET